MNCHLLRIHMLQKIATSKKMYTRFRFSLDFDRKKSFHHFPMMNFRIHRLSTLSSVLLICIADLVPAKVGAELVGAEFFSLESMSFFFSNVYIYPQIFLHSFSEF